jgi:signal peptidase II
MRSPARVFWPLAGLLVLADCSTKRVVEATVPMFSESKPLISDLLRVTLAYNEGAAFSTHLGIYQRWVLIAVGVALLGSLAWWYKAAARDGRTAIVGLALVAGGGAGNLLDRLISNRGVVDFLDFGIGTTRFFIFNVADAGIFVGALFLAFTVWRRE